MIGNKRGLSTIVVTLIIVLLSLVAVGIVWVVVRNILVGGAAGAQTQSECTYVNVDASGVACWPGTTDEMCNLTLTRSGTSTDVIGGVYLNFRNSTLGTSSSSLIAINGTMQQQISVKKTLIDSMLTNNTRPDSVDVTVYFTDTSGNRVACQETNTETF